MAPEKVLVHTDLGEVRLDTRMLGEAVQPAVEELEQKIGHLEPERICSAAARVKEVRYMAKGRGEWEAASHYAQLVVLRQAAEHKYWHFLTKVALVRIAAVDRQLVAR